MTRLRPAIAVLLAILLLQVTVLGGGMACSTDTLQVTGASAGEPDGGARPHDSAAHHGDHGVRVADGGTGADATPDGSGAPPHHGPTTHCTTAAGCAAVAISGPEVVLATLGLVRAVADARPVAVPPSTRPAPEPPPPRG